MQKEGDLYIWPFSRWNDQDIIDQLDYMCGGLENPFMWSNIDMFYYKIPSRERHHDYLYICSLILSTNFQFLELFYIL